MIRKNMALGEGADQARYPKVTSINVHIILPKELFLNFVLEIIAKFPV